MLLATLVVLANGRANAQGNPECWSGPFTYEVCCDTRIGPNGNEQCWDGPYNFGFCCTPSPSFSDPAPPPTDPTPAPVPPVPPPTDPAPPPTDAAPPPTDPTPPPSVDAVPSVSQTEKWSSNQMAAIFVFLVWLLAAEIQMLSSWNDASATTKSPGEDLSWGRARFHLMTLLVFITILKLCHQVERLENVWMLVPGFALHCVEPSLISAYAFIDGALMMRSGAHNPKNVVDQCIVPFLLASLVTRLGLLALEASLKGSWDARELMLVPLERLWSCADLGLMWYVLALAWWQLAAPALKAMRLPIMIAFLVALSGPRGTAAREMYAAREAFFFLPCFTLGLCWPQTWRMDRSIFRFLALIYLCCVCPAVMLRTHEYVATSAQRELLMNWWSGTSVIPMAEGGIALDVARYVFYGATAIALLAFLGSLPVPGAGASERTTYTLVMHSPLAHVALQMLDPVTADTLPPLEATLAIFGLSFLTNVMLTSTVTSFVFGWILEPKSWLNMTLWSCGACKEESKAAGFNKETLDSMGASGSEGCKAEETPESKDAAGGKGCKTEETPESKDAAGSKGRKKMAVVNSKGAAESKG